MTGTRLAATTEKQFNTIKFLTKANEERKTKNKTKTVIKKIKSQWKTDKKQQQQQAV